MFIPGTVDYQKSCTIVFGNVSETSSLLCQELQLPWNSGPHQYKTETVQVPPDDNCVFLTQSPQEVRVTFSKKNSFTGEGCISSVLSFTTFETGFSNSAGDVTDSSPHCSRFPHNSKLFRKHTPPPLDCSSDRQSDRYWCVFSQHPVTPLSMNPHTVLGLYWTLRSGLQVVWDV